MQLIRGQKINLVELTSAEALQVGVALNYGGPGEVDISCFGVDDNNKLSDDRYLVFYNQTSSPEGALKLIPPVYGDIQHFHLALNRLPRHIKRLVFVATIDGPGAMNQLNYGHLRLLDNGAELARFVFSGYDFSQEKAVMMAEIYLKDGLWRFWAEGQGFSSGLRGVLRYFGGEELLTPPPTKVVVVTEEEARQMEAEYRVRQGWSDPAGREDGGAYENEVSAAGDEGDQPKPPVRRPNVILH